MQPTPQTGRRSKTTRLQTRTENDLRSLFGERFQRSGADYVLGTVWPRKLGEIVALVGIAAREEIPLVPRGAGTSPYAGAIPLVPSIVVSFERMNRILEIDRDRRLVRVQPGVIWRRLRRKLHSAQLMPCVYPSSEAISTVGGFVAQGGVGVGSFQYGGVSQTLRSVRLVTGKGVAMTLCGQSLEIVAATEGRTGLLTEVTVQVQPYAAMLPLVALFRNVEMLELCLGDVARPGLPLWSVCLMDPAAIELGAGVGRPPVTLPERSYAAVFSCRQVDGRLTLTELRTRVRSAGGWLWPNTATHDECVERFMTLQACGTTPIPMQFRLPLGRLAALEQRIPPRIRLDLAYEGVVADRARCLTLRFFLRNKAASPRHNFHLALELLQLVKSLGGEIYATGAYFTDEADVIYSDGHFERIDRFRACYDPGNLFNPGKAF